MLAGLRQLPAVLCKVSQTFLLQAAFCLPQSAGLLAGWLSCAMEELVGLHGYSNPLVWEKLNGVQGWQHELPQALGTMWYWYAGCFLDLLWKDGVKELMRKERVTTPLGYTEVRGGAAFSFTHSSWQEGLCVRKEGPFCLQPSHA